MTRPAPALDTDEQLSGRAADAVADMHGELQRRYSDLNTAEAELAEALLMAHATSETGRARLQDIQRQLVEAIHNPVNALDTPAGERQFLVFLRGKISEIQQVVDHGALTAEDQAELVRALADGYLGGDTEPVTRPPTRPSSTGGAEPPAGTAPAAGMAALPQTLGGLPQAAAPAMPPGPGGLGAAASPLAGLASLLAGQDPLSDVEAPARPDDREHDEIVPHKDSDDEPTDDTAEDDEVGSTPDERPPDDFGPAETRPAVS